jgi:hypothetical protein
MRATGFAGALLGLIVRGGNCERREENAAGSASAAGRLTCRFLGRHKSCQEPFF